MSEKVLLSRHFKNENIVAKEDILEMKPSAKGLVKLKEKLGVKDWEMLYVGDGHDDYLAAKGANVFFALIAQGLVKDMETIRDMRADSEFGGDFVKLGKSRIPKFIVAFSYGELLWWFKELGDFRRQIKAVCFDLGDTLIVGGREEAYRLTDKNWPTWDVDRLIEESKIDKKLKEALLNIRIENRWRKLGDLPGMNSSEARIASFFLLQIFGLKEKELVASLYSEVDEFVLKKVAELSKKTDISVNVGSLKDGTTIKEIATLFPPEQFSLFIAASLMHHMKKEKREPKTDDVAVVLKSSYIWIKQYRKHEIESYKKHCKVPRGLKEFLEMLGKKKKKTGILTSKSKSIVETAIAYEKEVSTR